MIYLENRLGIKNIFIRINRKSLNNKNELKIKYVIMIYRHYSVKRVINNHSVSSFCNFDLFFTLSHFFTAIKYHSSPNL